MANTGRSTFSSTEDRQLFSFLIQQLKAGNTAAKTPLGLELWRLAEEKKITVHPHQSMLGRFRRKLWPNFEKSVLLSKEEKLFLKTKFRHLFPPSAPPIKKQNVLPTKSRESLLGPGGNKKSVEDDGFSSVHSDDDHSDSELTGDADDNVSKNSGIRSSTPKEDDAVEKESAAGETSKSKDQGESRAVENVQALHESQRSARAGTEPFTVQEDDLSNEPTTSKGEKDDADSIIELDGDEETRAKEMGENGNGTKLRSGRTAAEWKLKEKATRSKYSEEEDIRMLEFLAEELKAHNPDADDKNGERIWQLAATNGVTTHSAQSMQTRFRRILWPNMEKFDYIPGELKTYLLKRYRMLDMPPQPTLLRLKRKAKSKKTPPVIDDDLRSDSDEEDNSLAPNQKRIKVLIEVEKHEKTPKKPHSVVPSDVVRRVLFSMAMDGLFTSNQQMKRFTGKIEMMEKLAKKYNVPLTEVLRIAESAEKLREVENALAIGNLMRMGN